MVGKRHSLGNLIVADGGFTNRRPSIHSLNFRSTFLSFCHSKRSIILIPYLVIFLMRSFTFHLSVDTIVLSRYDQSHKDHLHSDNVESFYCHSSTVQKLAKQFDVKAYRPNDTLCHFLTLHSSALYVVWPVKSLTVRDSIERHFQFSTLTIIDWVVGVSARWRRFYLMME